MFSQTVEYALRATVFLAQNAGSPQPTDEIAAATKVPAAYLSKVLQAMTRGGIVKSQRGVRGGFQLAIVPEELTVLQVVSAVDPIQRIRTCPLDLKSHGTKLCELHRRMDQALEHVEQAFGASTLAEILADPTQSIPLCEADKSSSK